MLQRRLICLSVLLFVILTPYAQVNLQTGSATFSLPMFNWQDTKSQLNTVVALSYNSGNGLRVNEVASNVGTGWNLVAGGVITRMQVGEPDDQIAWEGNPNKQEKDISKYPNGYLYNDISLDFGCPKSMVRYPIYGAANQVYKQHNAVAADKQLDYFSFQFNGKSGMFVLLKGTNRGEMIGDSKIKIEFQVNSNLPDIRTTIISFTIQDVDGLKYKFARYSKTKVLEDNYCDDNLMQQFTQPTMKPGGKYNKAGFENPDFHKPWVIGSWYLTEIEDPFTNRKVFFNYDPTPRYIRNTAGADVTYDEWHNYVIINHKKSMQDVPALNSITTPDGHTVNFGYGAERIDMKGDYALATVGITYNGRHLSRYQLKTTYFILNRYGTPFASFQRRAARLCLRSVKKLGVDLKDDSPPYTFDYYLGSNAADDIVPPPFSYAHDIWGFYNGDKSKQYQAGLDPLIPMNETIGKLKHNQLRGLCFIRQGESDIIMDPKAGYAKNGLLKEVVYPTGGTLAYEYEQNKGTFINTTTEREVGGVHVSKTSSTDGGYKHTCANPLVTNYRYVLNDPGNSNPPSSMWGLEKPVNHTQSSMYYAADGKRPRWTWGKPLGYCDYKWKYPGILSQNQSIGLSDFQKFMNAVEPVLGVLSFVSTVMNVVTIVCGSTGFLAWVALIVDIVGALVSLVITCGSNTYKEGTSIIRYNLDLNAVSPLPTQFKRVEVIEGTGGIGKTVHEFRSDTEYPIWEPSNPYFTAKQRFAPWAYGLPTFTSIYDNAGNLIKQTEYRYDDLYIQRLIGQLGAKDPLPPYPVQSRLASCKCNVKRSSSQRDHEWRDPASYATSNAANYTLTTIPDVLEVEFYGIYSGRLNLSQVLERSYKTGDPSKYVETKTSYQYNDGMDYNPTSPNNYEISSISTVESNGTQTSRSIRYNREFSGGAFDQLAQQNVVNLPVVTDVHISGSNNPGYISQRVTEFTTVSTGAIKPARTLELRTDRPLDWNNPNWSRYTGPASTDYSKFKVTQEFYYDDNGNLIGAKDEGGRIVTNIYDYADKFVIASVVNADPELDKPAYSSFEVDDSWGGWSGDNSALYVTNSGVTGGRALDLSTTGLSANINYLKPYLLSFWANNANVTVSNGTLKFSGPTYNGFTYYQYEIELGSSNVLVNGNAIIDELRLYPMMSRMRTITYDPLIGKTSECDQNNRITSYEYDKLGRLQFIKDEKKNIVKMYEYNNVSKQSGCPGTFTNKLIRELFTKSNCSAGYLGKEIEYTVPAGKYTSIISQEDADAKAEMELMEFGQQFADNTSTSAGCQLLYYNTVKTKAFTTETCPEGSEGGTVTYTVPANKYYSTENQADADRMAQEELDANGQAYANDPNHAVCVVDTHPIWEWKEGDPTNCVNQQLQGLATDINPNSPSFGSTAWKNTGESCRAMVPIIIMNNSAEGFGVSVYNLETFQSYYYYVPPHTFLDATILEGPHDVTISTSSPWPNGYYAWIHPYSGFFGSTFSVSNVNITANYQIEWQSL